MGYIQGTKKLVSTVFIFIIAVSCINKKVNSFQLNKKAVVHFSFQNISDSLKLGLYNFPIIKSSYFNEEIAINQSLSEKQFTIPCEYPSSIHFSIANNLYTGFIKPDDTLKIFIRLKNKNEIDSLYFKGQTKAFCDYYYKKQIGLKYPDLRIPLNMAPGNADLTMHHIDSLMANELSFLEKYSQKSNLPDWFIQTEKNQIIYLCNDFKDTQEALYAKILKKPFIPGKYYYKSIDTLQINNPNALFSYWYFHFLKDHLVYKNIKAENLSAKEWTDLSTKIALSKAKEHLSGEVRDIFEYEFIHSYLNWTKDLAGYDRLFLEHKNDFLNLYYLTDLIKKRSLLTDSVVKSRNDDFSNASRKTLKKNDQVPYFYLPDMEEKFISPNDFKDKIIYISFWATWCKPCIASIPQKNELIQKYSGNKNIVFINICISSQKRNWEKLVTERSIRGINLFANQNWSDIISQKYGISGVPAYFLICNGTISKPYCDGPANIEDDINSQVINKLP